MRPVRIPHCNAEAPGILPPDTIGPGVRRKWYPKLIQIHLFRLPQAKHPRHGKPHPGPLPQRGDRIRTAIFPGSARRAGFMPLRWRLKDNTVFRYIIHYENSKEPGIFMVYPASAYRMGKIVFQFSDSEPKETHGLPSRRLESTEGIGAGERLSLTLALSQRVRGFRLAPSHPSNRYPAMYSEKCTH